MCNSNFKISLLLFFCMPLCLHAQNSIDSCSTVSFQKILVNEQTNLVFRQTSSTCEANDKSILISGRIYNQPDSNLNFRDSSFISKLDKDGNVLWSKHIGPQTLLQKIITLPGNEYIIAHSSNNLDSIFITRLNSNGNQIWSRFYVENGFGGGLNLITVYDIIYSNDNHLLVYCLGDDGVKLIKLDLAGNLIWAKNFRPQDLYSYGFGNNLYNSQVLAELSDGYLMMMPYTSLFTNTDRSVMHLFKTDKQTGNLIWTKEIAVADSTLFTNQLLKTPNGFAATFRSQSARYSNTRRLTVANINNNGNLINAFRVNKINIAQSLICTGSGKLIAATTDTARLATAPYILYQMDLGGNIDWAKKYFIPVDSLSLRLTKPNLVQTFDKGLAVVLSRRNTANTQTHNYILKTDQTGNAGDCANKNIQIETEHIAATITDVSCNVYDPAFSSGPYQMEINNEPLIAETICTQTSLCDSIKIIGNDSSCNTNGFISYTVKRNAACFSTPIWKLSDSSIAGIIVTSDSSIVVQCKKSGLLLLKAEIPGSCQTIADSMWIHIFKSDSLNLGPDMAICANNTYTLHAGNGFKNYHWQNNSTDSIFIVSAPGKYFVTATDYCGNIFSDSITVTSIPVQKAVAGNDTFKCNLDTISLKASTGFIKYQWTPNNHIIDSISQTPKIFPVNSSNYYLTATTSQGCISKDTITITVYHTAPIYLGNDTSICSGESIKLDAGTGFVKWQWNTGDSSRQISIAALGTYNVRAFDTHGCISGDSISILNVYQNPLVNLNKDSTICLGQTKILNAGAGFSSYLWSDNSNTVSINVSNTGQYWVKVTDSHHCEASDTTVIKIIFPAPANFITKDTAICGGEKIILQPYFLFSNYLWSTGSSNNSVGIQTPGDYWLQVTDTNGCTAKAFFRITPNICPEAIYFPSAFTPGNDDLNRLYKPKVFGHPVLYRFEIYNRYGQLIFETSDYNNGWNGSINGVGQNSGSFVWTCTYQFAGKVIGNRKGSFVLIR